MIVFNTVALYRNPQPELDTLKFWVETLALHAPNAPVFLVGTRVEEINQEALRTKNVNILPIKEIILIKPNGKKKVRIVVRGDLQKTSDQTFSPTASNTAVRVFLSVVSGYSYKLHQLDMKNAFLNERMKDQVYLRLPEGRKSQGKKDCVYVTNASIYGLKNSPKVWSDLLKAILEEMNFRNCPTEPCLYYDGATYLVAYVDDLLYAGPCKKQIRHFEEKLGRRFSIKIEDKVSTFLGLLIKESKEGIMLYQTKYVDEIVRNFKMEEAREIDVSMQTNLNLNENNGQIFESKSTKPFWERYCF